jgi:hypothetical protein
MTDLNRYSHVPGEIRTNYFPNASLYWCRCNDLVAATVSSIVCCLNYIYYTQHSRIGEVLPASSNWNIILEKLTVAQCTTRSFFSVFMRSGKYSSDLRVA